MAQISRLKDSEISEGNAIIADDLNAEFDQLVSESNSQDTRLTAVEGNTFTNQKTFNAGLKTDTILEKTAGSGVTADSVRLKDGMAKVSGTPTESGEIGYDDNELLFHDGTDVKHVPAANEAMPIELTSLAAGQALTWDGSKWVNTVGIVQVVGSSVLSGSSSSSTSMVDVTGASLSITPKNTSNKVLVIVSWQFTAPLRTNFNINGYHQILRGATNISGTDAFKCGVDDGDGGARNYGSHAFTYLDSPGTTSEVTYKLQHRTSDANGAISTSRVTFLLVEITG